MGLAGGDRLAAGGVSAQFSAGGNTLTDFEADFVYKSVEEVCRKYGLSQAEYDQYAALRNDDQHLPDLKSIDYKDALEVGFSVTDHRKNYLGESPEIKVAEAETKKYPESSFESFHPILDRVLVMRITDNPDETMLEDGSTQNKKTGLITSVKYRQHSNIGIVLAVGQYVVLSGNKFKLSEFINVGDKITYGDYNSEVFRMDPKKVQVLCDNLKVNYVEDPDGIRVVRVQDVRGVEKRVNEVEYV